MTREFIFFNLAALLGVVTHWLTKWGEAWTDARPSFLSVVWKNPPEMLVSTICTLTLLFFGYVLGDLNIYSSYLAGFAGQSLMKSRVRRQESIYENQ